MSYKICKRCKKRCYDNDFMWDDLEYKNVIEHGVCPDCFDAIEKSKSINNPQGIFYCPKCNLRTNEKTPRTTCVICDTVLTRMGG